MQVSPALSARSLLFVPGNRPDRFAKAADSGADVVLCDLEDAVAPADKHTARDAVCGWVAEHPAVVRINAASTDWYADDLAAVAGAGALAVVLPKAEHDEALRHTAATLGERIPLLALLETARGVRDANLIAETAGVRRLLFGNIDFGLDAGITPSEPDEPELLHARSGLVLASRAAGLPAPVDGVCTALDDPEAITGAARRAAALGFGGKLCLHPRQVGPVNGAFSATPEQLRWAHRVLVAAGDSAGAAVRVDGEMIDRPRLELARRLLASAGETE